MEQIEGVIFILQRPDGAMLLQQRDEHSEKFPLSWVFPGGAKEETDASLEAVVIREAKEEYDIELTEKDISFLTHFPHDKNGVYLCSVPQDCVPIMHEGADMKWVTKEELKTMELGYYQNDLVPIIEKMV